MRWPDQMRKLIVAGIVGSTAVFLILFLIQLQTASSAPSEAAYNLYDAALGGTPDEQAFVYQAVGSCPFCPPQVQQIYSGTIPATIFNSMAEIQDSAGYTASPQTFDRAAGFTLQFTVRIKQETHNNADRAGFSVILLAEDLQGIELAFWPDRIWAQADTPLFTHAEEAVYDTTSDLTVYDLTIMTDTYSLAANGTAVLTGPVRDYTAWEPPIPGAPDPYETPNLIFLGDDTSSAAAEVWLQNVTISYASYQLYLPLLAKP